HTPDSGPWRSSVEKRAYSSRADRTKPVGHGLGDCWVGHFGGRSRAILTRAEPLHLIEPRSRGVLGGRTAVVAARRLAGPATTRRVGESLPVDRRPCMDERRFHCAHGGVVHDRYGLV